MNATTIAAIKAKQGELNTLIDQFCAAAQGSTVELPSVTLQLKPGERYAGLVLDDDGQRMCHLVLLPGFTEEVNWDEAGEWAEEQAGDLPSRREQALLFANCKPHLQPRWHWSREEHESEASYAWTCFFFYGYQSYLHKSAKGCAVAVRRITA